MANDLSGSLADLAVNQFGVNASGQDLTNTANMIAKALNGQFGVLEKSGIRFTDAQRHMIQFGTETEKASALQEGFAQNLKFTNEVALQTFEGQLAKLMSVLGDISEEIGGVLIPILTEMVTYVQPVIDKIITWMQEHPKLTKVIVVGTAALGAILIVLGAIGLVVTPLIAAFGALSSIMTAVTVVLGIILSPIGLVIAAVAAIGVAVYLVVQHWEGLKFVFNRNIVAITGWVLDWVDSFRGAMEKVKNYLIEFIMSPIETIRAAYEGFFSWLKGMFSWLLGKSGEAQDAATPARPKANRTSSRNRALGGTTSMDEPFTMVGETGRELVRLPAGSRVTPAHQTRQLSGGLSLSITVQGSVIGLSPRDLVRMLGAEVMKQINPIIAHA